MAASASSFAGPSFTGPYQNNYADFVQYLQEVFIGKLKKTLPLELEKKIKTLGAVYNTDEHYFAPNQEVQFYSQQFFSEFWSSEENIKLINTEQEKKFKGSNGRNNIPQCISFVIADVESSTGLQKICFVSVSSIGSDSEKHGDMWEAIKKFIEKLNNKITDDEEKENNPFPAARYELLDLASKDFHELMRFTNQAINTALSQEASTSFKNEKKECAEKGFITELVKLFYERAVKNMNVKINGVLNVVFYPFQQDNLDKKPQRYVISGNKMLQKGGNLFFEVYNNAGVIFSMPIITCCPDCRLYKNTILYLMLAAKQYGIDNYKKDISSPLKKGTSPLKTKITPEKDKSASASSESSINDKSSRRNLSSLFGVRSLTKEEEKYTDEKQEALGSNSSDSGGCANQVSGAIINVRPSSLR